MDSMEDCMKDLSRQLSLLMSFLNSEYKGKANLDIVSISYDNSITNYSVCVNAYVMFKSSSFSCYAEFDDFMERFDLFYETV
jgi:hypothetical protein